MSFREAWQSRICDQSVTEKHAKNVLHEDYVIAQNWLPVQL